MEGRTGALRGGGSGAKDVALRFGALALLLPAAAAIGYLAVLKPDILQLRVELSPALVLAAAAGLAAAVVLFRSPDAAAVFLVGALYLNLSDVLVRQGLPSVLQLLLLPVLLTALRLRRPQATIRVLAQPLTWMLAAYVLVLLFSSTYAGDTDLADARIAAVAKAFLLYLLVLLLAGSRPRLPIAFRTVVVAAAFLAALAVIREIVGDIGADFGGLARVRRGQTYGGVFDERAAGPLGDPNFFAQILVPAVPLALFLGAQARRVQGRVLAFGATALLVAGIFLTYSRGGALALALVGALSLVAHGVSWRRVLAGGTSLLLAAALLMPTGFAQRLTTIGQLLFSDQVLEMDSSFEERLVLNRTAAEMFLHNPLHGVGAANYPVRYGEYVAGLGSTARDYEEPGAIRYPHNLYLEVAAETGAIGLAVFLGVLVVALVGLAGARSRSLAAGDRNGAGYARSLQIALLGYLASSVFLHGHFERYLWLLLALGAAAIAAAPPAPPFAPMAARAADRREAST